MAEEFRSFKVVEVAERLRVDPRTVYNVIASGDLRAIKVGRLWRIPADALEDYLGANGRHATPSDSEGRP